MEDGAEAGTAAPGAAPSPLTAALEALLFSADRPLTTKELASWLGVQEAEVTSALQRLQRALADPERGICLRQEAGGWRLLSKPEWGPLILSTVLDPGDRRDLSRAALEVLAIVAYRQPVTRAEVDSLRGARSDRHLARLVEEGLIEVAGRAEGLGRPLLFRTTRRFLEFVGLESLDQLPPLGEGDVPGGLHIPRAGGPR